MIDVPSATEDEVGDRLAELVSRVPDGWSAVVFEGRRYGLRRSTHAGGRSLSIFAEELGGSDVVSANVYRTSTQDVLKPCEVPAAKVLAFLRGWTAAEPRPDHFREPGESPAVSAATEPVRRPRSTMSIDVTSHTLEVPGASIHYELRGSGPVLAMIGAPMGSSGFASLAELMAVDHTVLTYDPRGSEGSTVLDRTQATTPELLADDVHRVLAAVTDQPVTVLGSSGGAVTGLALVTAHPEQVGLLIAHEPPVITLLDDAAAEQAAVEDIYQTYLRAGSDAAMRQFLLSIGVLGEEGSRQFAAAPEPEPKPASEVPETDNDFFYANQIRATTGFRPDLAALTAAPTRIVVGVGATSSGQLAHRSAVALADQLGLPATEFPGDHGGFENAAPEFATRMRELLGSTV